MVKKNNNSKSNDATLNTKQELFCRLYVSREFFANGTQAYIEAYNIDSSQKETYSAARVSAHRLLTNANILTRIDQLLELAGLSNQFVDKQLTFLITQNADLGVKIRAISEYNKLKKRVSNGLLDDPGEHVAAIQVIYRPRKIPNSAYEKYLVD